LVMQAADEHGCPRCGVVVGGKPYDVRESRIKDLPCGHRPLLVVWRKRRYRCPERRCPQRVFTERSAQVLPRCRLTARLGGRLEQAASRSARALSDVAAEYDVSWWSVHQALVVAAAVGRAEVPTAPVRMLGLDETRARSLRWTWADGEGWRLSNPWMTSFVDLDLGRPGWLLDPEPRGLKVATMDSEECRPMPGNTIPAGPRADSISGSPVGCRRFSELSGAPRAHRPTAVYPHRLPPLALAALSPDHNAHPVPQPSARPPPCSCPRLVTRLPLARPRSITPASPPSQAAARRFPQCRSQESTTSPTAH
jgi:zinc-finger of transposase IS204/IS1001/IS1096/IS1165